MSANTGGPAFPNVPEGAGSRWDDWDKGMTLRDYFAAKAMAAMMVANYRAVIEAAKGQGEPEGSFLAGAAYELADAMLTERSKPVGEQA